MSAGSLGSAQGEILINVQQALANLQQLEGRLKGMDSAGSGVGQGLTQANGRLDTFGTKVQSISTQYAQLGRVGLGVGAVVAGGFGLAINTAANFEQAMDGVGASLGGVGTATGITNDEFGKLNDAALKIGANTSASATEVAGVMDSLAKSGISVQEIYGGVAEGVVHVSEATGESLGQTADSFGALTNLFRDTGISSEQMADVIVNGMNNSNASLSEFQTGIARLGPVIAGTGMSFNDSAAAIAYFNSQGFSAAEVGTSLTAAYNNLVNPTKEQAAAQKELGISAFDSKGQFVGFPAIMDQIAAATAGMTDEQRAATLAQIFGADAMDLMTLASKNGGAGLAEYETRMDATGTAAAASAQRMDNLKGSIEQLKGAFESAMIVVGSGFIPIIRAIADGLAGLVNGFLKLPSPIQKVITALVGITGALAGVAGAVVVFGPQVVAVAKQMQTFITAIRGLATALPALLAANPIILLIVAALALLAIAYKTNLFGFRDAVNNVASAAVEKFKAIADGIRNFAAVVKGAFEIFRGAGQNPIEASLNAMGQGMDYLGKKFPAILPLTSRLSQAFKTLGTVADKVGTVFSKTQTRFEAFRSTGLNPVSSALKAVGLTIKSFAGSFGPLSGVVESVGRGFLIAGDFVNTFADAFRHFNDNVNPVSAALKALGNAVSSIAGNFGVFEGAVTALGQAFISLGQVVGDIGDIIQAALKGDWSEALDEAKDAVGHLGDAFKHFGEAAASALRSAWNALSGVDWGGVLDGITSALGNISDALLGWLQTAADAVRNYNWAGLWDNVQDVTSTIVGKLGNLADRIAKWVRDSVQGVDWSALWNNVKDVTADIVRKLGNLNIAIYKWFFDAVRSVDWGSAFSTVKDVTETILTRLGDLQSKLIRWATDAVRGVNWVNAFSNVKDVTQTILTRLGNLENKLFRWVTDAIAGVDWAGFGSDIGDRLGQAIEGAVGFAAGIKDKLIAEFDQAKPSAADLSGWASSVAGAVVGAITTGIGQMVGFAAAIKSRILTEFNEAMPASSDLAGMAQSLASNLSSAITTGISGMVGFAATIGQTILSEFQQAVSGLDLSSIAQSVVDKFLEAIRSIPGGSLLTDALSTAFGIGGTGGDISSLGGGFFDSVKSIGSNIGTAIATGFQESPGRAQLGEQFNTMIDGMKTTAGTKITELSTTVSTGISTMATQVISRVTPMASQVQSQFQQMQARGSAAAQQMASQVGSAVSQMASQVQSRIAQMQSQATNSANSMRSSVGSAMSGMASQAGSAMSSFASSVQSGFQRAASAAQSGVAQIRGAVNSIGSLYGQGFSIGSSLGQGIAAGISSQVSAIASAAASAVTAAVNAANAAAQINSPSKLTMKTGLSLAEGLQVGIDKGAADVFASMADLIPSGNSALAVQSLPVPGRQMTIVNNTTVNALRSEELQAILDDSKVGGEFARSMPRDLLVGGMVWG